MSKCEINNVPVDANIALEVNNYRELYYYACTVVESDRPNADKFWFMERVISWMNPHMKLSFNEELGKVEIIHNVSEDVGEQTFNELVGDFMSEPMKSLVDKNHSPEQLSIMAAIGEMMNYRSLYWAVKEKSASMCDDDAFTLIELLICSMCQSVTMILDEGTVEIFLNSKLKLMAGDFSDLMECVLGPEFYELVEGEKDFDTDDVLGVIELYFES
ncbi:hypothetical protein [Pseudomonas sp. MF6747]|uniref:hypothetical protein n=1 Tax=Pseudomonas sp. MF6747 TaxID=2797527 RepID=UPI00190BFBDF|nr:hypothetical protein [Pseudomonas sp. MF6747]MBK3506744.1 hypothetical protein [Pseudomonas sp. MF6747]